MIYQQRFAMHSSEGTQGNKKTGCVCEAAPLAHQKIFRRTAWRFVCTVFFRCANDGVLVAAYLISPTRTRRTLHAIIGTLAIENLTHGSTGTSRV